MFGEDFIKDIKKLGISIHEILRYIYGGLLSFLLFAIVKPDETKKVVEALGNTLTIFIAFAIGAAIYSIHRPCIGELLYLLHEWIHHFRQKEGFFTCRIHYLKKTFGIKSISLSTEAYRTIRDSKLYNEFREQQNSFHLQHSELHVVYITFVLVFFAWLFSILDPETKPLVSNTILFVVSIFCLVSGIVGNILLCRRECKVLLQVNQEEIKALLEKTQFIKSK